MKNVENDLSIVIISWKMKDFLQKCLQSIYNYTLDVKFEIIVIDNNSHDGTAEMIEKEFPEIILIKNKDNRGVAPARNQGMNIAHGKYILVLDADVELFENSVLKLFEYMESNPDCGIVGSKLVDTDRQLQYSCKRFPNLLSFIFRRLERFDIVRNSKTLRYHTMQDWDHNEIKEVDYLIGACQFIRSDIIKKIGYYDENIFYGPEDMDFCSRVWNAGSKIIYYPLTSIFHHEQRITKKKVLSKISIMHVWGIFYIYWKYKGKIKR